LEAFIILGLIALILLFFFIIQTLFFIQHNLKKIDIILVETDIKLKKLNPLFNSIHNTGDIVEKESLKLKNKYEFRQMNQMNQMNHIDEKIDSTDELASLLASSIILGIKFLKRR